jgi:hypothetical protein
MLVGGAITVIWALQLLLKTIDSTVFGNLRDHVDETKFADLLSPSRSYLRLPNPIVLLYCLLCLAHRFPCRKNCENLSIGCRCEGQLHPFQNPPLFSAPSLTMCENEPSVQCAAIYKRVCCSSGPRLVLVSSAHSDSLPSSRRAVLAVSFFSVLHLEHWLHFSSINY